MIIDKVVRNVYAIGGGIILSAFGISFIATKARKIAPNYSREIKFTGAIDSISSIEDLEYSGGCKFYFYDKSHVNKSSFKISKARDFDTNETNKSSMFAEVTKNKDDCKPGRFFYSKIG